MMVQSYGLEKLGTKGDRMIQKLLICLMRQRDGGLFIFIRRSKEKLN